MKHIINFSFFSLVCWSFSFSCINPMDYYACGIVWNNGEIINLDIVKTLGKPDSNFIKVPDGSYIFKGHEYSSSMISLGSTFMNIIFDTSEKKTQIKCSLAMAKELEWLVSVGIVSMTKSDQDSAVNVIRINGGYTFRYYTKQRSASTFNDICFEQRSRGEICVNPPGECGLDIQFRLPIQTIGISSIRFNPFQSDRASANPVLQNKLQVKVFDLKGNLISGSYSKLHSAPGVYFLSEHGKGSSCFIRTK